MRRAGAPEFKTEAELCAKFIAWVERHSGFRYYDEDGPDEVRR